MCRAPEPRHIGDYLRYHVDVPHSRNARKPAETTNLDAPAGGVSDRITTFQPRGPQRPHFTVESHVDREKRPYS
jgi:hypothetical protein